MNIKTTILSTAALMAVVGCSQRSYVMSFQPVSDADKYAVPKGVDAQSTTPTSVSSPEMPSEARKIEKPNRVDSPLQAIDDSSIDNVDETFVEGNAVGSTTFTGNEAEHVRFTSYNPFTNGELNVDLDEAKSGFTYPIDGKFSSGYGRRGRGTHSGVDLVAPALTPIYAAFDGVVRLSKPYSGYGNIIVVRHSNGLETIYAHNTKNLVSPGQNVKSGQEIAKCGRTGRATTNHLHFEVRVQGQTINPTLLIDVEAKKLQSGMLRINKSSNGSITAKLSRSGGEEPENAQVLAEADVEPNGETNGEPVAEPVKELKAESAGKNVAPASASQSKGIRVGDKVYDAPAAPEPKAQYHNIVSGDTLSTIARKYGTTTSELCRLNSITKDSVIKTGKKLRVK